MRDALPRLGAAHKEILKLTEASPQRHHFVHSTYYHCACWRNARGGRRGRTPFRPRRATWLVSPSGDVLASSGATVDGDIGVQTAGEIFIATFVPRQASQSRF